MPLDYFLTQCFDYGVRQIEREIKEREEFVVIDTFNMVENANALKKGLDNFFFNQLKFPDFAYEELFDIKCFVPNRFTVYIKNNTHTLNFYRQVQAFYFGWSTKNVF